MAQPHHQSRAAIHTSQAHKDTSRLVLATTAAVGAAFGAILCGYGFILSPQWAEGKGLVIFTLPILFAVLSFFIFMRPDNGPRASHTGIEAFSGHLGPSPATGQVDAAGRPELRGEMQAAYESQLNWHAGVQSKLRATLWLSYGVFALGYILTLVFRA